MLIPFLKIFVKTLPSHIFIAVKRICLINYKQRVIYGGLKVMVTLRFMKSSVKSL